MEVNKLKRYSSYKLQPEVFKLVLNFPPSGELTLWRNQKPQLSGKRAKVERSKVKFGDSWVVISHKVHLAL